MKHIDDWLDEPAQNEAERAAKEWLEHFRRPAISRDHDWLSARVLTCEYRGKRYRCIGASRMGDVWLTADMSRENGYDLRIDVAECGEWRMMPNDPKLSDGGGWRDGCAGEGGGAASVTAGAVRCSAWLGVAVDPEKCSGAKLRIICHRSGVAPHKTPTPEEEVRE